MPSYTALRPSRSVFVPIRLYRYHAHLWGEMGRRPPLVLVHGWMDVGASYQFMVDALTPDFFADRLIIAPDWRGFGQSTGPACDHYTMADYLGDLDGLLDHFCGDAPVDLMGHSMGGNVAMMYAGARPARIRRLINLEGFGLPATRPEQAPARYAQWMDEVKGLHRGEQALKTYPDAAGVAARLQKTNPRLPADKAHWLARQWAEPRLGADGATRWHIRGDAAHRVVSAQLFRADEMRALYAAITAPTQVVETEGSGPDQWWKGRYSLDEFHQRLQSVPQCQRTTLPDCGHMLHHDQPALLARQLQEFLHAP